jgi:hypothetical protein
MMVAMLVAVVEVEVDVDVKMDVKMTYCYHCFHYYPIPSTDSSWWYSVYLQESPFCWY